MDVVMSHPGAIPFSVPPVVGGDFPDDYLKVLRNPIDFTTISCRLDSHKYATADAWLAAVDLVFENARRYYQDGPMVTLGEHILTIFQKVHAREFESISLRGWCQKVVGLRNALGRLNADPPPLPLCDIEFTKRITPQIPSDREIKAFLAAMTRLTKPEDHAALLALLKRLEPEQALGDGKVKVDLILLKPSTIRAMKAFVRERLETRGLSYDGPAK
jgi:hypothetical protein